MGQLKHGLVMIVCLLITAVAEAQLSFVFVPEIHGRTVDALFMARTVNMGAQNRLVRLLITVTEQKSGKITDIQTPAFQLLPGSNVLPPGLVRTATVVFGNNKAAAITRQSGYFPAGEYEYCLRLADGSKPAATDILAEQCFSWYLQPFSPLLLINPADGDKTCNNRPSFFWQPLLPNVPGLQYRLLLVELKAQQHKTEGINTNLPLINQLNIHTPMMFYPAASRVLEEGKRYAWQVTAYKGTAILAQSEIWEFTNSCIDKVPDSPATGFRDIEDLARGNFYVANGKILFAVKNVYNPMPLEYQITCISDPTIRNPRLNKIQLERGTNYVTIPLDDERAFRDGYYYQLEIKLPNGELRRLRLLYREPKAE